MGCIAASAGTLAAGGGLWWTGWGAIPLTLAVIAALLLVGWAYAVGSRELLLRRVRSDWGAHGVDCLVVLSDSPTWSAWIHDRWLPQLQSRARVLNYSKRAQWQADDLAVLLFRRFCGDREFNPAIVVVPERGRPLVFRFYNAFRELKHGRPQFVERQEQEAFAAMRHDS